MSTKLPPDPGKGRQKGVSNKTTAETKTKLDAIVLQQRFAS